MLFLDGEIVNMLFWFKVVFSVLLPLLATLNFLREIRKGWTEPAMKRARWSKNLYEIASNHTQVNGTLAGFSTTVIVLLASVQVGSEERKILVMEQATVGFLMLAFFGFVSAGILYSVAVERKGSPRYFVFSVASCMYYFAVVLIFGALLPLVRELQYSILSLPSACMTAGAAIGGFCASSIPLHDLLAVRGKVIKAVAIFAATTGLAFREFYLFLVLHVESKQILQIGLFLGTILVAGGFVVALSPFLLKLNFLRGQVRFAKVATLFSALVSVISVWVVVWSFTVVAM